MSLEECYKYQQKIIRMFDNTRCPFCDEDIGLYSMHRHIRSYCKKRVGKYDCGYALANEHADTCVICNKAVVERNYNSKRAELRRLDAEVRNLGRKLDQFDDGGAAPW